MTAEPFRVLLVTENADDAALAALEKLLANRTLRRAARVVLFNTGTGLKYLS